MAEETAEQVETQEEPRTYTDAEVDAIIQRKLDKWQRKQAEQVEEARRMAEMDATQKAEYERDKLQKQIDELMRERSIRQLTDEGRSRLKERGVEMPDSVLGALIGDDSDQTAERIDAFAEAFTAAVEAEVKKRLAGSAPKASGEIKRMTKDEIFAIPDRAERQKAIRENQDLFV